MEQSDKKVLSLSWQTRLKNKIRSWVALGLKHHPAKERPETQKKGKVKQTKTHNLLNRISNYIDDFMRFTSHPEAAFDNNQAERDVRMNKVKVKISGGFRAFEAAQEFMIIRSFIETLRKQGKNIMEYLAKLFRNEVEFSEILNYSP